MWLKQSIKTAIKEIELWLDNPYSDSYDLANVIGKLLVMDYKVDRDNYNLRQLIDVYWVDKKPLTLINMICSYSYLNEGCKIGVTIYEAFNWAN